MLYYSTPEHRPPAAAPYYEQHGLQPPGFWPRHVPQPDAEHHVPRGTLHALPSGPTSRGTFAGTEEYLYDVLNARVIQLCLLGLNFEILHLEEK